MQFSRTMMHGDEGEESINFVRRSLNFIGGILT